MDTKAAFEKWLKEKMPNLYHMAFIAEEDEMTNHFKASVFDMRTAWESAWQASRAAIEIELKDAYLDTDKGKIVLSLITVINEMASHGIRIKGKTE